MAAKNRYRPRKEVKMWLYLDKPDEARLINFIKHCKATRTFARMLRNGIRLMWSLGEKDVSVLFELFPWIEESMKPSSPAPDNSDIERQIAELKRIIMEQGGIAAPPAHYPVMKSPTAPPVAAIQAAKAADASTIADNFLAFIQ